jgi:Endosomal/lysosomal potassium channel TMEM175
MAATQQHSSRSERARSFRRLSSVRLEMFSDGVFAIAVTLLALQLRPPNLDGVTTVGGLLDALFEQRIQFGYYALNFVNVGGVWLEHHELLDPLEAHSRRLARKSPRAPWWWRTRSRHACSSAAGKFGTGATCEWQPGRRQASAHRGARHLPIPAFIGARPRAARAAAPVEASSPPARLRVRAHW